MSENAKAHWKQAKRAAKQGVFLNRWHKDVNKFHKRLWFHCSISPRSEL